MGRHNGFEAVFFLKPSNMGLRAVVLLAFPDNSYDKPESPQ